MPELNVRALRRDIRLPELRLPEMSRDEIAKAIGEARKELHEVRRDLSEYRREIEVPKVLAAVEVPKVDIPKVDVPKVDLQKVDIAKVGKNARKNARQAAERAGLMRRPSRFPFVLAALATLGLVAWALATPGVKTRLREGMRQARERMAERRSAWDLDEETHAFDVAPTAGAAPSKYSASIGMSQSPFGEPPADLPEGLGATASTKTIEQDQPARA